MKVSELFERCVELTGVEPSAGALRYLHDSLSHVNTVLQTVFGTNASGLAALDSPSSASLDNLRTSTQLTN